jgi:hypothetical protein
MGEILDLEFWRPHSLRHKSRRVNFGPKHSGDPVLDPEINPAAEKENDTDVSITKSILNSVDVTLEWLLKSAYLMIEPLFKTHAK